MTKIRPYLMFESFCLIASLSSADIGPNFLILSVNLVNRSAAFL